MHVSPNKQCVFKAEKCLCAHFFYAGIQKSLRSDFDMAYERGRISVSAEDGNTPPTFTRVGTVQPAETHVT